jgi:hypothetical protein
LDRLRISDVLRPFFKQREHVRREPGHGARSLFMALYKYPEYLGTAIDQAFDTVCRPGNIAPYSGIYRCQGCGREVTSEANNPLPPQTHHQHQYPQQGHIQWGLVVYADHRPK